MSEESPIITGDVVSVNHSLKGKQEGLVVGTHIDHYGRQVVEVQLENEIYTAWYPTVTRVRRTVYTRPYLSESVVRKRVIERQIYW